MNKKILVIGCHYDDAELGCAGTIINHIKNGDDVKLVIINSDETQTGYINYRRDEQKMSLEKMGFKNTLNDCIITFYKKSENDVIISRLDIDQPDILFVPWEFDTHQDHRRSSIIGQAVGRKRHIETYFYSSGSTYDFNPNVFNPIDFSKKKEILECFDTQVKCGAINIDIIEKREAFWGSIISTEVKHAEGFIARKVRYSYGD